jgi:hypothetical protein
VLQRRALGKLGDEEMPASRPGQRRADARHAEAIGVGLHHRRALRRLYALDELAPIGPDRVQVDGQNGG